MMSLVVKKSRMSGPRLRGEHGLVLLRRAVLLCTLLLHPGYHPAEVDQLGSGVWPERMGGW